MLDSNHIYLLSLPPAFLNVSGLRFLKSYLSKMLECQKGNNQSSNSLTDNISLY